MGQGNSAGAGGAGLMFWERKGILYASSNLRLMGYFFRGF
jgi:hypothetical protein